MTLSCEELNKRTLTIKQLKKAIRQYKKYCSERPLAYIYMSQKTLDWLTADPPFIQSIISANDLTSINSFYGLIIIINEAMPYKTFYVSPDPPVLRKEKEEENDKG